MVSYDQGKSHFDFSVTRLSENISAQLNPKLAEILKTAADKLVSKKSQ